MRHHTSLFTALLASAAIVGTAGAASAWPGMSKAPAVGDLVVPAQMGGMGGMGGGGMGGMGGGGMGGMGGGGMGGMGGGGMGGMGGGGMGGMGAGPGGMGGMGGGGMGGMGGMGGNVNVNRNVNVHVRGVRPWVSRPWFGTAVAGVTLGTIIAVSAVPPPPADNLCWFWVDASQSRGYWDWCVPPP